MKRAYQSAYRKLDADQAFRERLIHTLEAHEAPRRTRPRWLIPAALAACLIVLFGLGVPTLQRVLQPVETVSSAPPANGGAVLGSDGLYRDSQITNILLLCTDDGGDGNVVMLITLDQRNGQIRLSNFLTVLKLKTEDGKDKAFSALFREEEDGEAAVSLFEHNFGLAVDGYVWTDASAVGKMIDAMGGVKMELSKEEAMYFGLSSALEIGLGSLDAGEYTLTGAQALFYARIRVGSDFDRMQRQQKLAETVLQQAEDESKDALLLFQSLVPQMRTNLDLPAAAEIAASMEQFRENPPATHDVPDSDPDADGGMPDLSTLSQALISFVYNSDAQVSNVVRRDDGVYQKAGVTNVLIWIGAEDGGTDGVLLLSLDNEARSVRLANFTPALSVETSASGMETLGSIGTAEESGSLLCDAVEKNFGVAVNGYVYADHTQAIRLIDAVGKLPMLLSKTVEEGISADGITPKEDPDRSGGFLLSGEQAFQYINLWLEADTSAGLNRMVRQESILAALLEQLRLKGGKDVEQWISLVDTNLSVEQIQELSQKLPEAKNADMNKQVDLDVRRIPADFAAPKEDGKTVTADLSECANGLAEFLYPDLAQEDETTTKARAAVTTGNLAANLANGGIAVDGGDNSVYYVNFADNRRIYRWDAEHGTQAALTDGPCGYLNILNGDLYYVNREDGGIYCLPAKWNIVVPISVDSLPHRDLIVTDAFFYYTRGGEIFRRETRPVTDGTDTAEETRLPRADGDLLGIQWGGGSLAYFVRTEETGEDGGKIIAMYRDGDTPVCTFSNGAKGDRPYLLDGDTLYYCDDLSIHTVSGGKDTQLLGADADIKAQARALPEGTVINGVNEGVTGINVQSLFVSGDTLYFSEDRDLISADLRLLDGRKENGTVLYTMSGAKDVTNLCKVGDFLYFTSDDTQYTDNRTWRIKAVRPDEKPAGGGETAESYFLTDAQRKAYLERQDQVDNGHQPWRRTPMEVAQTYVDMSLPALSGGAYELTDKKDVVEVNVRKDNADVTLYLFQPATKGKTGIWEVAYYVDNVNQEMVPNLSEA